MATPTHQPSMRPPYLHRAIAIRNLGLLYGTATCLLVVTAGSDGSASNGNKFAGTRGCNSPERAKKSGG